MLPNLMLLALQVDEAFRLNLVRSEHDMLRDISMNFAKMHDCEIRNSCSEDVLYDSLNIICNQLRHWFKGLNKVVSSFDVLQPRTLLSLSDSELGQKADDFVKNFNSDVSPSFTDEILSIRSALRKEIEKISTIKELVSVLIIDNSALSSRFPEVCTALMMFLTVPVTVASAERSFSKLKLIKLYLRSTMSQERLKALAILSIEQNRARKVNFNAVIDIFADQKSRKKNF